jgi:hypothetical protein
MRIGVIEIITKKIQISKEELLTIFKENTCKYFQYFSDRELIGKITSERIIVKVRHQAGFADPFNSISFGKIESLERHTQLTFTVIPSVILILILTLWTLLNLWFIISYGYQNDLIKFLRNVGISFLTTIFPFVFVRLKVNWDKRRLEKWIDKNIKTT